MNATTRTAIGPLLLTSHAEHDVIDEVIDAARSNQRPPLRVVTPNAAHLDMALKDASFAEAFNSADVVVPDGWPIALALRWSAGDARGRVTGSDLSLALLDRLRATQVTVGLIGGSDEALAAAYARIRVEYPGLRLCDPLSNPVLPLVPTMESTRQFIDAVNSQGADVLLLCTGAPKSEIHLFAAASELDVSAVLCVGATVDFLAGTKRRAPVWVQKIGMEWLYRFVQEPQRLGSRYFKAGIAVVRTFLTIAIRRSERRIRPTARS